MDVATTGNRSSEVHRGPSVRAVLDEPAVSSRTGIDLYWLPLGAGGWFVRWNGRVYEALVARRDRRPRRDLYHLALEVVLPEHRFTIEMTWPIPGGDSSVRGVVMEGSVGSRRLSRYRTFRYELRCWRDGIIPDLSSAVDSPRRVSVDEQQARRLLELAAMVPDLVWGRDELELGEMWNSNSIIAWLLERAGVPTASIRPPHGGRAPGWEAGRRLAHS